MTENTALSDAILHYERIPLRDSSHDGENKAAEHYHQPLGNDPTDRFNGWRPCDRSLCTWGLCSHEPSDE